MDVQNFLQDRISQLHELSTELNKAYWNFATHGTPEMQKKLTDRSTRRASFLSNKDDFQVIQQFLKEPDLDPSVHRQLTHLYNQYLKYQMDQDLIEEIIRLETAISGEFTNFRVQYKNKPLSNNEIMNILHNSTNQRERQEVYLASKQIGDQVAPLLLKLVKTRNEAAKRLGFENYYSLALQVGDLKEDELFNILDRLKEQTDLPFDEAKKKADAKLARFFGIHPTELMPWHYSDPFFQEPPLDDELDLDRFIQNHDIVKIAKHYYKGIGLEIDDILQNSDLYERDGKHQHAFCSHIDAEGDVRILCNLRNTEKWLNTLLHELGHGVYDKYIDFELPVSLRHPGHMFLTEAIALMFGNQSRNPQWLKSVVGIQPEFINIIKNQLYYQEQLNLLIFIRWGLVMVYFERELYKNPDQDLNELWWSLVEELQLLTRPIDRESHADWAAKVHLGTFPVYYHNYILGYLAAYQIEAAVKEELEISYLNDDPRIGAFLIEHIFSIGAKEHWNDILKQATGHQLIPDFAVRILH